MVWWDWSTTYCVFACELGTYFRKFTWSCDETYKPYTILFTGSFATATCMVCKDKVDAEAVREDIFNQVGRDWTQIVDLYIFFTKETKTILFLAAQDFLIPPLGWDRTHMHSGSFMIDDILHLVTFQLPH